MNLNLTNIIQPATLGVIIGNRDFFPDQLVGEARAEVLKLFAQLGIRGVMVEAGETKLGGVETHAEARKCAELFAKQRAEIDGVLVVLPNFGDEKGVADALRLSGLEVPILVQACPDELNQLSPARRRDGFCGKISVCNNLYQEGVPFSLTRRHTVGLLEKDFAEDLQKFVAVCRVVKGLRKVRIGAVGARPGAFNTVRTAAEEALKYINGDRSFQQKTPVAVELVTAENVGKYGDYGKK
jgi:L-fucose isomerase-like protein